MSTIASTPCPWKVASHPTANTFNCEIKHGDDLVAVAACKNWGYGAVANVKEAHANARHIVHCVNSHDELLQCVRDVLPVLMAMYPDFGETESYLRLQEIAERREAV